MAELDGICDACPSGNPSYRVIGGLRCRLDDDANLDPRSAWSESTGDLCGSAAAREIGDEVLRGGDAVEGLSNSPAQPTRVNVMTYQLEQDLLVRLPLVTLPLPKPGPHALLVLQT